MNQVLTISFVIMHENSTISKINLPFYALSKSLVFENWKCQWQYFSEEIKKSQTFMVLHLPELYQFLTFIISIIKFNDC